MGFSVYADPECKNYALLSDSERSVDNVDKLYKCDKDVITAKWYRFVGDAGNQMPTSCVNKLHCGTHAPGWLDGQHPSVGDGVVRRKVCFNWMNKCCYWNKQIEVRNCGKFYVYKLDKPPVCRLRYCGKKGPVIEGEDSLFVH